MAAEELIEGALNIITNVVPKDMEKMELQNNYIKLKVRSSLTLAATFTILQGAFVYIHGGRGEDMHAMFAGLFRHPPRPREQ